MHASYVAKYHVLCLYGNYLAGLALHVPEQRLHMAHSWSTVQVLHYPNKPRILLKLFLEFSCSVLTQARPTMLKHLSSFLSAFRPLLGVFRLQKSARRFRKSSPINTHPYLFAKFLHHWKTVCEKARITFIHSHYTHSLTYNTCWILYYLY